jgi:ribosome maturation factor RimP
VSDAAGRLWRVIEPYIAAENIELDDLEVVGGSGAAIVRVTVDADDPIDVDRIARLSRGVSRLLDEDDPIAGSYTLEVSSPGLERKLRRPRHFEKAMGRRVKVKTREPVDGERSHDGLVAAAGESEFVLETDGVMRTVAYDDVISARTVFVWEKTTKPGSRR